MATLSIVGLPDTAVQEAWERVRAAVRNSGSEFPMRRITVSMAPADLRKSGPAYDLGNFLRRLALPKAIQDWSLRSL